MHPKHPRQLSIIKGGRQVRLAGRLDEPKSHDVLIHCLPKGFQGTNLEPSLYPQRFIFELHSPEMIYTYLSWFQ